MWSGRLFIDEKCRWSGMRFNKSMSIFCVDDDDIYIEILKRTFGKVGFENEIVTALDGIDALEKLEEMSTEGILPQIMLIDINMPRMNGIELLKEIRKNEKYRHVLIYMLSTSDYLNDVKNCYDQGISSYFIKPLELADLKVILSNLKGMWEKQVFPEMT